MKKLKDTTLVLGGGGLWGVAWMTGLLMGLEESGVDMRHPRAVIGTSAGSVLGAHVTSDLSTPVLFDRQVSSSKQARQYAPDSDNQAKAFALFSRQYSDPDKRLRAICDLTVNTQTIPWVQRRADIQERLSLPSDTWPSTPLTITAVEIETRSLTTFDAGSGVDLVDAVAASCAVPGIWPIAEIGGRRYIDGGVWLTPENAHLATNAPFVLILSPFGRSQAGRIGGGSTLDDDIARLCAAGSRVVLITADQSSLATLGGGGPLDPATRRPSAESGRIQGRREAASLRATLS